MSDASSPFNPNRLQLSEDEAAALLLQLRRKEGAWVEWGKACQQLQQAGHNPQIIFEATGFEPIQQNQVIVAAQVYDSLVNGSAPELLQQYFWRKGSDILYEFRQLDPAARLQAAQIAMDKNLDMDEAHIIAQDIKNYQRLSTLPDGFERQAGDAIAYFCWKRARERSDIAERSRLIAQGLRYAHSAGARQRLEKLLTDFTVTPTHKAPTLPLYRIEEELEMPRIIPLLGTLPLPSTTLSTIPPWQEQGPFRIVQSEQPLTWVALPGWQSVFAAKDPVSFLCNLQDIPAAPEEVRETVVLLVDRQSTDWSPYSYFLVDRDGSLSIDWFPEAPDCPIVAQVLLLLRPKRVLDENAIASPWDLE